MGGNLEASYAIGRMIRARNLDVYVTRTEPGKCAANPEICRKAEAAHIKFGFPRGKLASCASACTNILASGSVRSVGATALVGIHQAAYYVVQKDALRVAANRRIPELIYIKMKDFLVEMGVDANLMSRLLSTPHQDMYWLTHDELKTSRLTNQTKERRGVDCRRRKRRLGGRLAQVCRRHRDLDFGPVRKAKVGRTAAAPSKASPRAPRARAPPSPRQARTRSGVGERSPAGRTHL